MIKGDACDESYCLNAFAEPAANVNMSHVYFCSFRGYARLVLVFFSWIVFDSHPTLSITVYSASVALDGKPKCKVETQLTVGRRWVLSTGHIARAAMKRKQLVAVTLKLTTAFRYLIQIPNTGQRNLSFCSSCGWLSGTKIQSDICLRGLVRRCD